MRCRAVWLKCKIGGISDAGGKVALEEEDDWSEQMPEDGEPSSTMLRVQLSWEAQARVTPVHLQQLDVRAQVRGYLGRPSRRERRRLLTPVGSWLSDGNGRREPVYLGE